MIIYIFLFTYFKKIQIWITRLIRKGNFIDSWVNSGKPFVKIEWKHFISNALIIKVTPLRDTVNFIIFGDVFFTKCKQIYMFALTNGFDLVRNSSIIFVYFQLTLLNVNINNIVCDVFGLNYDQTILGNILLSLVKKINIKKTK